DGIRDFHVTGVQTCALPISAADAAGTAGQRRHRWLLNTAISSSTPSTSRVPFSTGSHGSRSWARIRRGGGSVLIPRGRKKPSRRSEARRGGRETGGQE